MAIGDFLAGAGRVGAGMRRAQSEMRAARLEQLRMEEANRAQQMYDQLAGQMRAGGLSYKPLKLGPELPVEVVETPPPEKKKPAAKPKAMAKPAASAKPQDNTAVLRAISAGQDIATVPAAAPAAAPAAPAAQGNMAILRAISAGRDIPATTVMSNSGGTPNLGGGAGTDRLESPRSGVPTIGTGPVYDPYGRTEQRFPETSRIAQMFVDAGLATPAKPQPAAAAQQPSTGQAPLSEAEQADWEAKRAAAGTIPAAGVRPPEARVATAPVQPTVSPAAPTTPQEVVQYETAVNRQPVPEAVKKKVNYYTADPTKIPYEMQRALDKREELVRYANIMLASRTGQGVQAFLQIKQQIDAIDYGMIELQGMQGIEELTSNNDPVRLAAVLSEVTGNSIAIQPRSDGTYNLVAAPGTPEQQVIEGAEGISADEVAAYAMVRFSPSYRAEEKANRQAIEMKRIEAQIQANLEGIKAGYEYKKFMDGKLMDISVEEAKLMNALQVAHMNNQGKITAAMAKAAGKRGVKLFNAGDGSLWGQRDDGAVLMLTPGEKIVTEERWFGPDVTIQTPGRFETITQD